MTTQSPIHARAAFLHTDFRLFQAARFASILGAQMLGVAVGWQVYSITHRPLDLGYVGLAQFVPVIGLSLVAGQVADRVDRRRIVTACYFLVALCALLLFAISRAKEPHVAWIYAVLVVLGTARAFSAPASQALLPSLVPEKHFANAVAWGSSVWQIATIAGPSLGGALYGAVKGPTWVYASCAVLAATAGVLIALVKPRDGQTEKRSASWETLLAGVKYVREKRMILGSISLDLFAVLLGGATALLPVFASDILHVGPWGLGILRSAPAVGAASVAVLLAHRPLARKAGATMLACVGIFGVATIVFGLSKSFPLSLAALFVLGASDMISVMVRSTLVQLATPPHMRGRVSAVNMMFVVASNELGEFESGITAAWLGAVPAVVLGGIGSVIVVILYAFGFPELRKVDRLDAPEELST